MSEFGTSSGLAVVSYWDCIGIVLGLFWACNGTVLRQSWAWTVLGLCWGYIGIVLGCNGFVPEFHWACAGAVLCLYSGTVLGLRRVCAGI